MFKPLPTSSKSVSQLFRDKERFSVPNYQRPYSWSVDEAAQLLEDISIAAGIDEGHPIEDDYFLGAILLLNPDGSGGGRKSVAAASDSEEFEIVDGQQRLVTLTILACVLRDSMPGEPQSMRLHEQVHLATPKGDADDKSFRINLSGSDREFMATYVQAPGSFKLQPGEDDKLTPGQKAILAARDRFALELEDYSVEQRKALSGYICDSCHFVVVVTTEIDRAHRIFMVLNDRGRPLDKKDILKAEILRAVTPARSQWAHTLWQETELMLGSEMESFLSHVRTAHGYHRLQAIAGVRRVVNDCGSATAFMRQVFAPLAAAYASILSAREKEASIPMVLRQPLVSLSRLNGREWLPAAMQVLNMQATSDELKAQYLVKLERAAYLMRLLCLGAGKRQTRFAKISSILALPEIPEPDGLYEPSKEELRTIAFNLRDLHSRNAPACKALLMRLNDELQPDAIHLNPSRYTVEHVLPQRPRAASVWRELFPDSERRVDLTGSLGNLILVSPADNVKARNEEYERKKEIYAAGKSGIEPLALTRDVLANSQWREEDILQREKQRLETVNKIWQLDIQPPG
ncbi:MAG: DUF262 domain-containing HNH endonuclease family protein [Alphaproteobacteria bacterium]|nr:DUF262 domain-containing HNH endonuclease family protein [Alphaproteobacteria bacterium]